MNIEQFWKVLHSCGDILSLEGFEFTGASWVFGNEDYTLSFEAPSDRFGRAFQVRYLTLCLAHTNVPGPDLPEPWLSHQLDGNCPVQISPSLLLRFKSARFKKRVWHYGLPYGGNQLNLACYLPAYYGGESKLVLKDKSATTEANNDALLDSLRHLRIDYASEKECIDVITSAANAVAGAGKFWANYMTPELVLSQLRQHESGWWIEKEWIRGYRRDAV